MNRLSSACVAAAACLLLVSVLPANTSNAGRSEAATGRAVRSMPMLVGVDNPVKAGSGAAAVDSVVLAHFTFDNAAGDADAQGWAGIDFSAGASDTLCFHLDDFAGVGGYAPLTGARSLWCGARTAPHGETGGTWPGYGNRWDQRFESMAFTVSGTVQITFNARYDLEQDIDFAQVEYSVTPGTWLRLAQWTGQATGMVSAEVAAAAHSGSVRFRLRVITDEGWSDEDGLHDTTGALVVDNLTVQDSAGVVDSQDFETGTVGATATADGHWSATKGSPFGLYTGLIAGTGVLQQDPGRRDDTHLWSFIVGSVDNYACGGYPEQASVPRDRDTGERLPANYLDNAVRSPWIRLDREEGGAFLTAVPDTVSLQYQVYHDNPLERSVGWTYRWRFRGPAGTTSWLALGRWFGSAYPRLWTSQERLIAVASGALEMQVALECVDWSLTYPSSDPCHSQAPLFDNVRLKAAGQRRIAFEQALSLPGIGYGSASSWGDYDNDGDPDLVLTGDADLYAAESRLHRNNGGVSPTFTDVGASLLTARWACSAWGDYDRDGDIDLVISGQTEEEGGGMTALLRNGGGTAPTFVNVPSALNGYYWRGGQWGDCDGDGDLDLLLGASVFRSSGGPNPNLTLAATLVTSAYSLAAGAWGDYDNDGDLDALVWGTSTAGAAFTKLFRNLGGAGPTFTDSGAPLVSVMDGGAAAWGDVDNDGLLDVVVAGITGFSGTRVAKIYRNGGGTSPTFTDIGATLTGVAAAAVAWGDCDNDGDLDLALAGSAATGPVAKLYQNSGGSPLRFTDTGAPLTGTWGGSVAWADYDRDGDLDLALTGRNASDVPVSLVYRNLSPVANEAPAAPSGLASQVIAQGTNAVVTFSWTAPADDRTPANGLRYALRVGTTPSGCEILSPHADPATGYRRVSEPIDAPGQTSRSLLLPRGVAYYWSVQAVDASFAGSPFATENALSVVAYGDTGTGLPSLTYTSASWGDFDGDGDQDLVLTGIEDELPVTRLYRNDGAGAFTLVTGDKSALPGLSNGVSAWGDYDNDGDLDLLLGGDGPTGPAILVYSNDGGGSFTDIGAGLPGANRNCAAWGDYDNDGDLDLYASGLGAALLPVGGLYRNDGGGVFTSLAGGPAPQYSGGAAWADADNDGDLDLLVTGNISSSSCATRLYGNNGDGTFTQVSTGLPDVWGVNPVWMDYDNDGDADVVIAGTQASGTGLARLYANDGTVPFTEVAAGLPVLKSGSLACGDHDADGDPDLVLAGQNAAGSSFSGLWMNTGGVFAEFQVDLPATSGRAAGFADIDGDGDLDLMLGGGAATAAPVVIYRCTGAVPNASPTAPANLRQLQASGWLTLDWDAATDARTPAAGLSYNLRIGTTPNGGEVVSGMSLAATGRRLVPQAGNAQQRTSWMIRLSSGWSRLYCSVQAVDAGFAGSPFSTPLVIAPTGVVDDGLPTACVLRAAAPNPFNPSTRLSFDLPAPGRVRLAVFDVRGRIVRLLLDEERLAGRHEITWDGRGNDGHALASGVYLARLETAAGCRSVSMSLVK